MRDMSEKEFQKALKRRGWRVHLGLFIQIPETRQLIGLILHNTGKVNRRASLARAIARAHHG